MVEIRPVGPCDAEGASTALESMRTSEEGAIADRGMWWEVEGFYVNEECEFDLISIEQQPIKVLTFSDSKKYRDRIKSTKKALGENDNPAQPAPMAAGQSR